MSDNWKAQTNTCCLHLIRYKIGLEKDTKIFAISLGSFIEKRMWTNFYVERFNEFRSHESLKAYVEAQIPVGLETTFEWLHAQLLGPSRINEDCRIAFNALEKQMEVEGIEIDTLTSEAQQRMVKDVVAQAGSQTEAGKLLGVDQPRISRSMSLGHKGKHARDIWMPVSPDNAAAKIREKFGDEFAEELSECIRGSPPVD